MVGYPAHSGIAKIEWSCGILASFVISWNKKYI
jgi:hypothetical protein